MTTSRIIWAKTIMEFIEEYQGWGMWLARHVKECCFLCNLTYYCEIIENQKPLLTYCKSLSSQPFIPIYFQPIPPLYVMQDPENLQQDQVCVHFDHHQHFKSYWLFTFISIINRAMQEILWFRRTLFLKEYAFPSPQILVSVSWSAPLKVSVFRLSQIVQFCKQLFKWVFLAAWQMVNTAASSPFPQLHTSSTITTPHYFSLLFLWIFNS